MGRTEKSKVIEIVTESSESLDQRSASQALAMLARWATRRAQRIAKERSCSAGRNPQRNSRLRPQDGEERT